MTTRRKIHATVEFVADVPDGIEGDQWADDVSEAIEARVRDIGFTMIPESVSVVDWDEVAPGADG